MTFGDSNREFLHTFFISSVFWGGSYLLHFATAASSYLVRGAELENMRRLLEHTTCTIMQRYVHLNQGGSGPGAEKEQLGKSVAIEGA